MTFVLIAVYHDAHNVLVYMYMYLSVQIELVNDKIGMVYSGMGPDFRYGIG